jgi:molybdopterin/thiamine biosynthesis adenylyltransferase
MSAELRLTNNQWGQLREHLLADRSEHAAVLVCGTVSLRNGTALTTRRVIPVDEADLLHSSPLHLSISPVTLARVAKEARAQAGTVVLCHSHPWPGRVVPSSMDLDTEANLCGRALAGRLAPRPVGAIVLGPDSFSARIWQDGDAIEIDRLKIVGDQIVTVPEPDGLAASDEVARQVLAWGNLGQNRLTKAHVAVIGAGGTGSQIAIQLAHLGVGRLTLVDFDIVERSNLSRLLGSTPADVGRSKVDVLASAVRAVNPDLTVHTFAASVIDVDPLSLADADVVICATDGHGSRALLTEMAQQYLVPVVDLGVNVVPAEAAVRIGGQVRVLRPGRGCLHCAGTLDPALVREEYLTDAQRADEQRRGYLRGVTAPAPAVIALNGVIASLACLEVCQLLAGFLGTASDRVLYRAHRRAVTTACIRSDPACYVCGTNGLLGLGDGRDLPVRHAVHGR